MAKKRKQTKKKDASTPKSAEIENQQKELESTIKSNKTKLTEEEKREGELPPLVTRSTENKQLIWFVVIVTVFFLAFLGPYFYLQNQKTFEYAGVTWQVEKDGPITFYHTQFGKNYKGQYLGAHNAYFRNNPKTNNIPIEIGNLSLNKHIIITLSPEVLECDKQILAVDALYQITQALPFITERTIGLTDSTHAQETNKTYATCTNKPPMSTVIQIELGETSKVTEIPKDDCYKITIKKCEDNLITAEKLVLEVIRQMNEQ
jgi:hypothetical protein